MKVAYKFFLTSPTESTISFPSYLDGFRDGMQVAIQLLFNGMFFQGFVRYDS